MIGLYRSRGKFIRRIVRGLFASVLIAAAAGPAAAGPAEDVQALVERAAAHIQAVGQARAYADFNRPDGGFVEGELYVFCDDADGIVLAHGDNPKLVGKRLTTVRDAEGRIPSLEIYRLGHEQGQGWIEYLWPNPHTRRVQRKITYALRIDDRTVCASGFYKVDLP